MHTVRGSVLLFARLATASLILVGVSNCRSKVNQPITIRYLQDGWVPPSDMPPAQEMSETFLGQTGLKLEVIKGAPAETDDQLKLIQRLLRRHAEGPDVLAIDETWLGTLKDELVDLRPYLQSEAASIPPGLAASYIIDGKVLAIPYQNQAGVLVYRADLLEKYGYRHPPRTWKELEAMAALIQAGERARGKRDFWGYLWPGGGGEPLTCNALEWQVDDGGGSIIESDGSISVNNPTATRSWERARRWIGRISPPSVTEYGEIDVMRAFEAGSSAFARVWSGEAGVLATGNRPELRLVNWWNKPSVGEAGFTALPGGAVHRVSTLGGAGFAVSKYSLHPQEDATLIRFMLGEELRTFEEQKKHSFSQQSVLYDANDIAGSKAASPDAPASRAYIVARPTSASGRLYDQVSSAYSEAVHSVLTGKKSASDAASDLERNLVRITGLRARRPATE